MADLDRFGPIDALESIMSKSRSPLTIDEGLAAATAAFPRCGSASAGLAWAGAGPATRIPGWARPRAAAEPEDLQPARTRISTDEGAPHRHRERARIRSRCARRHRSQARPIECSPGRPGRRHECVVLPVSVSRARHTCSTAVELSSGHRRMRADVARPAAAPRLDLARPLLSEPAPLSIPRAVRRPGRLPARRLLRALRTRAAREPHLRADVHRPRTLGAMRRLSRSVAAPSRVAPEALFPKP
jgi:hypothetical protein